MIEMFLVFFMILTIWLAVRNKQIKDEFNAETIRVHKYANIEIKQFAEKEKLLIESYEHKLVRQQIDLEADIYVKLHTIIKEYPEEYIDLVQQIKNAQAPVEVLRKVVLTTPIDKIAEILHIPRIQPKEALEAIRKLKRCVEESKT
jgi:hypothetical protein